MEKKNCILDLSYPDISGISPDPRLASLLYEAYAGRAGELATISNYLYQSIIFHEKTPVLSDLLECISITETEHFKILGKMIILLGGDPRIKTQIRGSSLKMSNGLIENIEKMLAQNIEDEKTTMNYYNKIALHTHDKAVVSMLKRIIMDEDHHIKLFSDMLNDLK